MEKSGVEGRVSGRKGESEGKGVGGEERRGEEGNGMKDRGGEKARVRRGIVQYINSIVLHITKQCSTEQCNTLW